MRVFQRARGGRHFIDLLRLRSKGHGAPPNRYDIRRTRARGHDHLVVREEIRQRDHASVPGAPRYLAHTYYYNDSLDRFELADSALEYPEVSP